MKLLNLGCGNIYHLDWINLDFIPTGPETIPCNLIHGIPFAGDSFNAVYHSHLLEHMSKSHGNEFMQECYRVLKPNGIIRVVVPDLERIARLYLKLLNDAENGHDEGQNRYDWIMLEMYDQVARNQSGGEMMKLWNKDQIPAEDFIIERCGVEFIDALPNVQNEAVSEPASKPDSELDRLNKPDMVKIGKFRLSGEPHQWMYDRHSLRVLLQEVGFQDVKLCEADESAIPNFKEYHLDSLENGGIRKPDSLFMEARKNEALIRTKLKNRNANLVESRSVRHNLDDHQTEILNSYKLFIATIQKRNKIIAELDDKIAKLLTIHEHSFKVLPLVSIVTPVFNCAQWIDSCIQSVLNQNYPKIEHIIIDGGSTDGTLDICKKYPHLEIHTKKDRGQSHAINKGFAMAHGEVLAWLCGDDEYEPNAITIAVQEIIGGRDVVMGYSRFIDAEGNFMAEHPSNIHHNYDHSMLLNFWKYNPISQPATFWRRKIWNTCGPLKENLFFAMDYDLWLRISQKTVFKRIEAYFSKYRIHPKAKCFADNYGSKIELINVSRQYWPAKWNPRFWKLYVSYAVTKSNIAKHFSDGEKLLGETIKCLDGSKRWRALFLFFKAHFLHFATPYLPNYIPVLERILKESIGPGWFWNQVGKAWYYFRRKKG